MGFSGGKTQKLMLDRCLYKDRPIIVLDEPTSALDALEIDYDIMEDANVLQKISNAEYTMEHTGGYYAFITYYRELIGAI